MSEIVNAASKQIVVTGTAGRASIATMIAAVLCASGERVVHINGHWLHSEAERLSVDCKQVDRDTLAQLLGRTDGPLEGAELGDVINKAARVSGAGWYIMSGVQPLATQAIAVVAAPILPSRGASAAEHAAGLLRDLPATETIVSAPQRESVLDVLRDFAATSSATMVEVSQACRLARERSDLDGQSFRLKTPYAEYRLRLSVLGAFQVENAAAAILALEIATHGPLDMGRTRSALESVRLPGRLELLKRRPLVVVDSGSVGAAVRRAADGLRELSAGRRIQVIVDACDSLDPIETVRALAPLRPDVVATGDSVPTQWGEACYDDGLPYRTSRNIASAIELALETAEPNEAIAVLGSRQAAAAARAHVLALLPPDMRLN